MGKQVTISIGGTFNIGGATWNEIATGLPIPNSKTSNVVASADNSALFGRCGVNQVGTLQCHFPSIATEGSHTMQCQFTYYTV